MPKYKLTSDANCYTPGIVAWAKSGYWNETDQPALRGILSNGYGLPDHVAHGLLTGEISYTVEDDAVCIEVGDDT